MSKQEEPEEEPTIAGIARLMEECWWAAKKDCKRMEAALKEIRGLCEQSLNEASLSTWVWDVATDALFPSEQIDASGVAGQETQAVEQEPHQESTGSKQVSTENSDRAGSGDIAFTGVAISRRYERDERD